MAEHDATWKNVWSRPAVLLPPLATVLAVVVAACGVLQTIDSNNSAERRRERSAFALAAAEVVMNQGTCKLSQARARTLIALFPQLGSTLEPLTKPNLSPQRCEELRRRSALSTGNIIWPSIQPGSTVDLPGIGTVTIPTIAERRKNCVARFGRIYKPDQIVVTVEDPLTRKRTGIFNPCHGLKPKP